MFEAAQWIEDPLDELPRSHPISSLDEVSEAQYGGERAADNVRQRWRVYRHVREPADFGDLAINALELSGTETVLDVGCADGLDLHRIRTRHGHFGRLIGVDPSLHAHIATSSRVEADWLLPIHFIVGIGQHLPLPPNSVDAALANFVLYHLPDPEEGLRELQRVVRPQGRIAITTSGTKNKSKHRDLEKIIGEYTGSQPPPIFSQPFNAEVAAATLPQYFEVVEYPPQNCAMIISTQEGIEDYLASLGTMKDAFTPIPTAAQWREAEVKIRNLIETEIEEKGSFRDWVHRQLFVCRNIKPY